MNGEDTQKWQLLQEIGQKSNKYTIWLLPKSNENKGQMDPVPVR